MTKQVTADGRRTTNDVRDSLGRIKSTTVDPSGINAVANHTYDLAGNISGRVSVSPPILEACP